MVVCDERAARAGAARVNAVTDDPVQGGTESFGDSGPAAGNSREVRCASRSAPDATRQCVLVSWLAVHEHRLVTMKVHQAQGPVIVEPNPGLQNDDLVNASFHRRGAGCKKCDEEEKCSRRRAHGRVSVGTSNVLSKTAPLYLRQPRLRASVTVGSPACQFAGPASAVGRNAKPCNDPFASIPMAWASSTMAQRACLPAAAARVRPIRARVRPMMESISTPGRGTSVVLEVSSRVPAAVIAARNGVG